jgi:broad specificity phosphatase PhoE
MESVILARHGESEYSVRAALNGDPGIACGLTEAGEEQARALGEELARTDIDLCVTSAFERVRRTADLALVGRDVPRIIVAELGDPDYGPFEGGSIEEYRTWASSAPSSAAPNGGGESRLAIVGRYVHALRTVLARPESSVLVVAHSLPLAYVLGALAGDPPAARMPLVEYAHAYRLTAGDLAVAISVLEEWCASPAW